MKNKQATRTYSTTQGKQPKFCNNYKGSITFNNCFISELTFSGTGSSFLSLVSASRSYSSLRDEGLSSRRQSMGFRSCSTCSGTRKLPGPGVEPESPALAGGFLSTEAPGKS